MKSKIFTVLFLSFMLYFAGTSFADTKENLIGNHYFSLHWLSWDDYGTAIITEENDTLKINANQIIDGDYVAVNGDVTIVNDRHFKVNGKIVTKVHHINNGEPCIKKGEFDFVAWGNRKYWRLQDQNRICDGATNYIDVYFKKY